EQLELGRAGEAAHERLHARGRPLDVEGQRPEAVRAVGAVVEDVAAGAVAVAEALVARVAHVLGEADDEPVDGLAPEVAAPGARACAARRALEHRAAGLEAPGAAVQA